MLQALTLILVCQLAGEFLVAVIGLPVPGPVIGMLLLLVGLGLRGRVPDELDRVTGGLLDHLSLLFVPAGVGAMVHWVSIREQWVALAVALLLSTVLGLAATALTMKFVARLLARGECGRG